MFAISHMHENIPTNAWRLRTMRKRTQTYSEKVGTSICLQFQYLPEAVLLAVLFNLVA